MPSPMIHLMTAYNFDKNASIPFFVGNISPDWISDRFEKDKSHFRDRTDRMEALRSLANSIELDDDYSKGVLLHLYLDYFWDVEALESFAKKFSDESWFLPYRNEISHAGSWEYHNISWSKDLWSKIDEYPLEELKTVHGIEGKSVRNFVTRNYCWYNETKLEALKVFTPQYVEAFCIRKAIDFREWLNTF